MNSSFEAAERLFKLGEFDEIRRSTDLSDAGIRRLSTAHQLILAQALALIGDVQPAIQVVRFVDTSNCTPLLRSKYHLVLGLADERTGASAEALAHFQTALRFAAAAADILQIAWSHVRILRHMIDRGDCRLLNGTPARGETRRDSGRRHSCHRLLTRMRIRLRRPTWSVRRSCQTLDIADSLLSNEPNTWLRGSNLVNRGCSGGSQRPIRCRHTASVRRQRRHSAQRGRVDRS